MRAHQSSQGLQQLAQQQQPQQHHPRGAFRRIKSAPGALHDLVADFAHEMQMEAVIHAPAFTAGACFASSETFPPELLALVVSDPSVPSMLPSIPSLPSSDPSDPSEHTRILASCLASPPDGEVTRTTAALRIGEDASGALVVVEDAERRRSVEAVSKWMRVRARKKKAKEKDKEGGVI